MHDLIVDMQTDKPNTTGTTTNPRVFLYSAIDPKDEVEEKLDRARTALGRLVGNLSEREAHDILTNASFQPQKHDEICLGLLGIILTDPSLASKSFRDLNLIHRDMTIVLETLSEIVINKYQKLTDVSRSQCLWLTKELVKVSANGAEGICWNIMRQIAGGDISGRNLWLSETMLDMYSDNSGWLDKYPVLIAAVVYTYLRLLEDHTPPHLSNLRQKEVNFVVNLIRDHFTDVIMNQQIGLGRDFLRLLQAVARIPEIEALWKDIYYNPKALSPHLSGVVQLLNLRTSRKYLQLRITPDMEKKLNFLTANVKFGMQKRYQEWFQRQYLSTPESQTLRADLIRFIVGVIHPPNEILCSDILPRWAVIGWLLTTSTNPVAAANAKLALFYDWLLFDAAKDNIMNIEPGILVMHHSLKPHLAITTTLLDFLIRLTYEYWPAVVDKIRLGISAAFKTILVKKVLPSLDFILENPKFEPELRNAIQEHLIVLLDRNNGTKPLDVNMGIVSSTNNSNSENHVMEQVLSSTTPTNLSSTVNAAISTTLNYSNPNTITLRASPPPVPGSAHVPVITSNSVSSTTSINPSLGPQSNTINSTTINLGTERIKIDQPDNEFSDDEDDDYVGGSSAQAELHVPKVLAGAVPARNSPTLGSSVDDAERSKIFEYAQTLPPNMRIAVDHLMSDSGSSSSKKDYLDDIIEELDSTLEDETRDYLCKCLIYIFKSELSKSCVNEETFSVIDNFTITPVTELLHILIPVKLSDKSFKTKNIIRILVELINALPPIAYKILIMLYQKKETGKFSPRREDNFPTIYKNLAQIRGIKFEQQLVQDMRSCWENDPIAVGYLCPIMYSWYDNDCFTNTVELLRLTVSSIDAAQLQDIVWKIMRDDIRLIEDSSVGDILHKSLDWESWEQHCLWTLVDAHNFSSEEFIATITQLDARNNPEALTALLMILKKTKPTEELLAPLLCRRLNQRDYFVQSLLQSWANDSEDALAEVLARVLVKASSTGSPVKRKRGPTGGRGTASPGGPPTPSVDNVLGHLDQFRDYAGNGEGIFTKDVMQAALLQVLTWVNDSLKSKYKELLALAAEEPDTKESRSIPKRSSAPRKLPSSPTPSGPSASSSTLTNSSSSASVTSSSTGVSNSNLSKTRSGRVRTPLKDESSESSDEDDDMPRPKKVKKRKTTSAFNSDSD